MNTDTLTITKELALDLLAACVTAENSYLFHINSECEHTDLDEDECRERVNRLASVHSKLSAILDQLESSFTITNDIWISLESDGFLGYEINAKGDVRKTTGELIQPQGPNDAYELGPHGSVMSRAELLAGHFGNPELNENFYNDC